MALEPSRALRGALLSLPIAALALWWAFRGVQAGELFDAFAAVRLGPLLLRRIQLFITGRVSSRQSFR